MVGRSRYGSGRPQIPTSSCTGQCQRCDAAGRADLSHRARHGAGALHRRHPLPGRRQAAGGVLQGRPARQERRRARQDRSAPVTRPRSTRPRPRRPRTKPQLVAAEKDLARFQDAGAQERRNPAEPRSAAGQGRSDQGRRSPPTRPRSKPRRPTSTTPTSWRRATAAWACAWSIPATSCMPTIRARSPILTQTQPAAVLFTLPAQTLDDVRDAMARGAGRGRGLRPRQPRACSAPGTLSTIDNLIDQATATYQPQGDVRQQRTRSCGRASSSTRGSCSTPARTRRHSALAVQRGPNGLFTWVVKPDNTVEPRADQDRHHDRRSHHRHLGPQRRRARRDRRPIQAADKRIRRHRRPARQRPSRATRHEHLRTVHPPADRDHAADGGAGVRRHRRRSRSCRSRRCRRSTFPTIQVTATWPGASAETMATSVAAPLERQFGQIAGITQMTSQSALGATHDRHSVRSQSQHRLRRAGRAGGDHGRQQAPCRRR